MKLKLHCLLFAGLFVNLAASANNFIGHHNPAPISKITVLTPDANGILYVKKGSTGNGSSWANALGEVADALIQAKSLNTATPGTVTQIWVAGGTYHPLYRADNNNGTNPTDRDNSFVMVESVKLYGGFEGNETGLAQRDLSVNANESILSGDFNNDDTVTGAGATLNILNNTENAYHVIIGVGTFETRLSTNTVLDGFTVKGGFANNANDLIEVNGMEFSKYAGAGINSFYSNMSLKNLKIMHNAVDGSNSQGAGIKLWNSNSSIENVIFDSNLGYTSGFSVALQITDLSSPYITNCNFKNNKGSQTSAWEVSQNSLPLFTNIIVAENHSANATIGIRVNSTMTLTNCTIANNTTTSTVPAISLSNTSIINVRNSIVYGNTSASTSVVFNGNPQASTATFTNSIVQGSNAGWSNIGIDGGNNLNADPLFTNAAAGNYTLQAASPAIGAGNSAFYNAGATPDLSAITTDLAGNARIEGTSVDMGAYEYNSAMGTEDFVQSNLVYYPVPVTDVLNLTYNTPIHGVMVYNMLGQVVLNKKINATSVKLDTNLLQSGSYILHVETERGSIKVNILKN